ncbi:MAG: endonuclease/exonuclease/phosphatase family protein [Lentimicrobiaceae bacterium]|nr:endonuclease/exonuclease/phosphatase family protein [Lentimicrobiaceae bacterium]
MPHYYPLKKLNTIERLRTTNNLLKLREQLDKDVPQKTATDNLLLATWNIREFGNNRNPESLHYIAEIVSRFDLIAVQEVAANLQGLQDLVSLLNLNWDYFVTDSTDGSAGGNERMAFIYDKSKISFKKMAGEIVLPKNKLINEGLQFARTPYCIAFQANWFKFVLTTVHIYYGSTSGADMTKRVNEINAITSFLAARARKEDTSYVLLGDFNIPKVKDKTMEALESNDFFVPAAIKEHPSDLGTTKHYDQIAFNLKLDKNMTLFSEKEQKAGAFNFTKTVYSEKDVDIYKAYFPNNKVKGKTQDEILKYYLTYWRTFQMSDHLPLWVELKIDFSNQYLEKLKKN